MKIKKLLLIGVIVCVFAAVQVSKANAGRLPVNLGLAGSYTILTESGISTTGSTLITGDIGVSPIAATAITGFGLTLDASNQFSTSTQVVGKVYAADYSPPTPANLTTAVSDMQTAYTDAAGRTLPDATELGSGEIGGMTIVSGLYKWSSDVLITTDVTINGGPGDVWIFQIDGNLTVANGKRVILSGGAKANNIFWQVAGGVSVAIGTNAHMEGVILAKNAITMATGASWNGKALAQKALTLQANAINGVSNPAGVGNTDILWRDISSGEVYIWLMNGLNVASQGSLGVIPLSWQIETTGDFDGDGRSDILWRDISSGEVYVWLMNGQNVASQGSSGVISLSWQIETTGDFDGDGRSDILWRNASSGEVYIWFMNGQNAASQGSSGVIPLAWQIKRTADFDGDGKSDILWRHATSGQVYIWFMNGLTRTAQGSPGNVADLNWQIQ